MSKERQARIVYRRNDNGRLVTEQKAKQLGKDKVAREHMPLPGYGDTKPK